MIYFFRLPREKTLLPMNVKRWFLVIAALGLALRLAYAVAIEPVLIYDALEYHQYAENLVKTHHYFATVWSSPNAPRAGMFYSSRAPGYVFFVAAVYELFGVNDRAVGVAQAGLDFLSGVLVFLIALNWLAPRPALLAYLAYQVLLVQVPMLMSEAFFLPPFLLSLCVLCGPRARSRWWLGASGLAWGVIILTKPEAVIFVPLIVGHLIWKERTARGAVNALTWLMLAGLVIAPWLMRERAVHGRFIWITTRGGMTFFDGNYLPIDKRQVFALGDQRGLDEAGMDRLFYRVTLDYLEAHPAHYFKMCFKRARVLLNLETYNGMERFFMAPLLTGTGAGKTALAFIGYYLFLASRLVMVLGAIGAIASWRRWRELAVLYAVPLVIILFHFTLFLGKPRYLVPAYPGWCIFSALLVARLRAGKRA
jgi:4-amino-4-deoxy-L-arabinose transferase-like glycosyltransferase